VTSEVDFFVKMNVDSEVTEHILNKVKNANDSEWTEVLDQSIYSLTIDDFAQDSKIYQLISDFGCQDRLSVFRFSPNVCFQWHIDKIRYSAINMLLDGFDSFCAFGTPHPGNKFDKVYKLAHEPKTYYLINVKKFHTVFNFAEMRYIISIGFPDIKYSDVLSYLKDKNLTG
jgi:hypothetical protein